MSQSLLLMDSGAALNPPMLSILLNYDVVSTSVDVTCKVWEALRSFTLWHMWKLRCSQIFLDQAVSIVHILIRLFLDLQIDDKGEWSLLQRRLSKAKPEEQEGLLQEWDESWTRQGILCERINSLECCWTKEIPVSWQFESRTSLL